MRRFLIASTVVASGLGWMGQAAAQQVSTKAPFEVTLDGFFSFYGGGTHNESLPYASVRPGFAPSPATGAVTTVTAPTRASPTRALDFVTDSRIILDAHATSDNLNMTYGVFLRLDADTTKQSTRASDRANLYASGDFGRLEGGDNKSAVYKLGHDVVIANDYAPPFGSTPGLNNGQATVAATNGPFESNWLNGGGIGGFTPNTFAGAISQLSYFGDEYDFSNSTKVTYLTPTTIIPGLQLGVSYSPDGGNRGGQTVVRDLRIAGGAFNSLTASGPVGAGSNYQNVIEGGAVYKAKIDDFGLLGDVLYAHATAKDLSNGAQGFRDVDSITAGLQLQYAGFKLGAAYTFDGRSRQPYNLSVAQQRTVFGAPVPGNFYDVGNAQGYAIGLEYLIGPWTAGGFFQHAYNSGSPFVPGSDRLNQAEFGLTYLLAPGLQLMGVAYYVDYHDDGALLGPRGAYGTPTENADGGGTSRSAEVYLIGSSINF